MENDNDGEQYQVWKPDRLESVKEYLSQLNELSRYSDEYSKSNQGEDLPVDFLSVCSQTADISDQKRLTGWIDQTQ